MYAFRSALVYLIFLLLFALLSSGQVVSVDKVKFTSLQNDWLMCDVEIQTGRNTLKGATSQKYVENVRICLYLGFENKSSIGGVDFFYSEVTALILERGDNNKVRFFIPGKIMEMNRYSKPQYYYAQVIVNQTVLKPNSRAYSSKFQNKLSLDNFVKKAKIGSSKNYGRLIPSYLTPRDVLGTESSSPVYLRINN